MSLTSNYTKLQIINNERFTRFPNFQRIDTLISTECVIFVLTNEFSVCMSKTECLYNDPFTCLLRSQTTLVLSIPKELARMRQHAVQMIVNTVASTTSVPQEDCIVPQQL